MTKNKLISKKDTGNHPLHNSEHNSDFFLSFSPFATRLKPMDLSAMYQLLTSPHFIAKLVISRFFLKKNLKSPKCAHVTNCSM